MRQRTRLLQPDQFVDEELAKLPPLVRLMFCALPTIADKAGRLPDRPALIKLYTLPYDDIDPDAALQSLADIGIILRYSVDNSRYIQIRSFDKHQKPHYKEEESQIPAPQQQVQVQANVGSRSVQTQADVESNKSPLPSSSNSNSELDSNSDSEGDERIGTTTEQAILQDFRQWKGSLGEDPLNRGGAAKLYELQAVYDHLFGPKTLSWIISHTKDVETDILKRPDRFMDFYQTDKWFAWVLAILKRAAGERKFGQSGFVAMSAAEEEAHYKQHRDNAACRLTQPGDGMDTIGGVLPGLEA